MPPTALGEAEQSAPRGSAPNASSPATGHVMRLITRYVLAEFAKVFFTSLTAMTLLMLLFGVLREAVTQGLGPAQVLRLVPYILPDSLRFTLPGTSLFAVSLVYGRMSAGGEVLALKALGIHPARILLPIYLVCALLSGATVAINELALSWGRRGVAQVVVESAEEIAYRVLRSQHSYSTPQFSVVVRSVSGRRLLSPVFHFEPSGSQAAVTVRAAEAELQSDRREGTLTVICRNGQVEIAGQMSAQIDDEFRRTISLAEASRGSPKSTTPATMSTAQLRDELMAQQQRLERGYRQFAALEAHDLLLGEFDRLNDPEWQSRLAGLAFWRSTLARLKTEPFRRWASGFSCLCFALVGAPLAIRLRNADLLMSFFLCFLPILIVYYPLMAYGVDAAKRGVLPPQSVWLGNVILTALGAWLVRHVLRY